MLSTRLNYATDTEPGLRRRRNHDGFTYLDVKGATIPQGDERERVEKLAIPPAWEDVWISPDPDGHIQATGRDARGRKQYIYHVNWRAWREQTKFEHILDFAEVLPRLRRRVAKDLRGRSLTSNLVCAAAVKVLEETLMRVGNDEYANNNNTYGLTTLRHRHLKRKRGKVLFSFVGKHGKPFEAPLADRRVRTILRRLEDLPGQHIFQYVDEAGETHRIRSDELNAYIREATGGDFTAKDFRTWSATVLAALTCAASATETPPTKKAVNDVVRQVALRLGNTPAVCRRSYIHPAVLECYVDGKLALKAAPTTASRGMTAAERQVLRFLRGRLKQARKPLKIRLTESVALAA
jgi:DNA topoisomerase-1